MRGILTPAEEQRDANDKQLEKKTRTRLACDECRKKRIKCDGKSPCDACIKSMTLCIKSRQAAKRGPKAGYIEKLEIRIKRLESLLTPEQWNFLDEMESSSSKVDSNSDYLSNTYSPKTLISAHHDLRMDLITLYFNNDHQKVPFLHEDNFMQNIKGHRNCLLYAIYSLGAMYQPGGGSDGKDCTMEGDFYFQLALNEINQITIQVPDYSLIGSYLLLMIHELACGRIASGCALYSRGCNLMLRLKYHQDLLFDANTNQKISETEREIRRRLFWLFYESGVCGSFVLGQTPILPENIYRGSLPMDDESFNLVASLERKYGPSYFMQNISMEDQDRKVNPIPFPLDDISSHEVPTGHLTHLMRILKVFEKIQFLNRLNIQDPEFSSSSRQTILMNEIVTSLQHWINSFKSWMGRKQNFLIVFDSSTLCPDSWNAVYVEILPLILNDVIGKAYMGDRSALNLRQIVGKAAISISENFGKYDFVDLFHHVHPFINTILFQLGITFAVLVVGGRGLEHFDKYKKELDNCTTELARVGRYYLPSKKKWELLRRISTSLSSNKALADLHPEMAFFKASLIHGYPLVESFVPPDDVEEYKRSRKAMAL